MNNITQSTLRPGFLVSLKTSMRGNVRYFRKELDVEKPAEASVAVDRWETERTIEDPSEHEAAKKAIARARQIVRRVCKQSAFGLLCPEVDAEKLDASVAEARAIVDDFNATASLSHIAIYVLTGRVMPDDVEALRAINSEIRSAMEAMSSGIEGGDADAIRDAARKAKEIGEMLATEAQTKVEMAVKTARDAAKQIVRDKERGGSQGTISIDRSAVRRINELRASFLDLDDSEDVGAAAPAAGRQLDLQSAVE
jgi:hypothetical protein